MAANELNLDAESEQHGALLAAIEAAENTGRCTWIMDAKGIRIAAIVPVGLAQAGIAELGGLDG